MCWRNFCVFSLVTKGEIAWFDYQNTIQAVPFKLLTNIPYHYAGFRLACRSPLCRYVVWSPLAVSWFAALSDHAALAYPRATSLPSWKEVNCLRFAAVGKAARLLIYWQDAACRLVIPLRQVALGTVEQISSSKRQCGERQASLKAALLV